MRRSELRNRMTQGSCLLDQTSLVVRKPAFCIYENKDAAQLRSNCVADQRLCFRQTDSTIPLLPKSKISSLKPSSLAVQSGLWQTWSETPNTDFLTTRLKLSFDRILYEYVIVWYVFIFSYKIDFYSTISIVWVSQTHFFFIAFK